MRDAQLGSEHLGVKKMDITVPKNYSYWLICLQWSYDPSSQPCLLCIWANKVVALLRLSAPESSFHNLMWGIIGIASLPARWL